MYNVQCTALASPVQVFEYVDQDLFHYLESHKNTGVNPTKVKKFMYQVRDRETMYIYTLYTTCTSKMYYTLW